jgi:hypothetical protein
VATGDSGCEAYTAIVWGVGLSHERSDIAGAESLYSLEGNMCSTVMRGAVALPGSKATSRAKGSYRNLGDLISDPLAMCLNGPCREGEEPTPAMYGGEKSDRARVAMKPANKAERSAAESVERRARAEGSAVQRHTRVGHSAGVGAPVVGLLRVVDPPLPKVGAVCGKAARTVLVQRG